MMNWQEIETLPRQGMEAIQLRRLQLLVQRVHDRVRPYREKMQFSSRSKKRSGASICPASARRRIWPRALMKSADPGPYQKNALGGAASRTGCPDPAD